MYKVAVKSSGKYNVVALGARYCLTRKSAIKLANLFLEDDCDITIEKFIRCSEDVFAWTDACEDTKIILEEDDAYNVTARKANKYEL